MSKDKTENIGNLEKEFLSHYPYDKNIFIMMRYEDSEILSVIESTIRNSISSLGLQAHFAKDKSFSDILWENVQLYMNCCRFGIAVFEQIDNKNFNPNISVELGYLLAQNKRCLLLKEQRLITLPSDITGYLYKEIDMFNIEKTITEQINKWIVVDLGLISEEEYVKKEIKNIFDGNDYYSFYLKKIIKKLYNSKEPVSISNIKYSINYPHHGDSGMGFHKFLLILSDKKIINDFREKGNTFIVLNPNIKNLDI